MTIEVAIRHLPVPAPRSGAKQAIFDALEANPRSPSHTPRTKPIPVKRWVGIGIAASLLAIIVGWFGFGTGTSPTPAVASPEDPLLAKMVDCNVALASSETPDKRMDQLAKIARELHRESQQLSMVAPGDDMLLLAKLYDKVVSEGMVSQMTELTSKPEDKARLRQIASELADAGEQAEQWAQDVPVASRQPLKQIAETARRGDQKIRNLLHQTEVFRPAPLPTPAGHTPEVPVVSLEGESS
jgi:hypothetical protein